MLSRFLSMRVVFPKSPSNVRKKHYCRGQRNILNLAERGMINEIFPRDTSTKLAAFLEKGNRTIYAGFDPTSDSLHVGNLLVLISLLHCQRGGHDVIALIGGATARIGDPSGKTQERPSLDLDIILKNVKSIRKNIETVFSNHANYFCTEDVSAKFRPLRFVNNEEWYNNLNVIDLFASVGRHFRLGRMLSRQNVKNRLSSDDGMSYAEFSYQVFQSYDWLHLLREYDCRIQIGGSDQMGNIYGGQELISRFFGKDHDDVYGITVPLITTESGTKFGKSEGNAIWLSKEKTSAFDFYQFFIRQTDEEIRKLLPLFSLRSMKEIRDIIESRQPRKMQTELAEELTLLVHGQEGLDQAIKTTKILYENDVNSLNNTQVRDLKDIFQQACYVRLFYSPGTTLIDFAMKIGCFRSEKDAIRVITAGGFYINHQRRQNIDEVIIPKIHILDNNISLVRIGKRNYYIVEWTL